MRFIEFEATAFDDSIPNELAGTKRLMDSSTQQADPACPT